MNLNTFRATVPSGSTFHLTLIMFVFLCGIAEWVARLEVFQALLTPPKMGSGHYQLGHKLALLEVEVHKNGPIDCIMLGSSMVDVGFDPDAFEEAYRDIAETSMRCFNFGIDASSAVSTSVLARILVEDYHPRILILGTDARDYVISSNDTDTTVILASPWIKYRQGHFSPDGWLLDKSYFYRYRQHLNRLLRFHVEDTLWSQTRLKFPILSNGFTPLNKMSTYINDPPNQQDTSFEVTYYTQIFSSYQMLDENMLALESIMQYNDSETQVILVEMPISDGLFYFFGNGETDYNTFVSRIRELATQHHIPFWQAESLDFIPDNSWADYSHLNVIGAEIFSSWLGEQVGRLDAQNDTDDSHP